MGKRQPKQTQTTLRFAIQMQASADDPGPGAGNDEHIPSQVAGSGLDVVVRNSERDEDLADAERARQGGGRKNQKKGHELDPAKMDGINSACWVFFRAAKKGENPGYVYCLACEYVENGANKNASPRVAITNYGKPGAHLRAGNVKSHLEQHETWWKVVNDAATKALDPRAAFADLMKKKKKRKVQGQSMLDSHLKKGEGKPELLEKELRLVIFLVRNNIPFNTLDDSSFQELLKSLGLNLSSSKTLKRYLFLLSEIAIRHAEKQIKERECTPSHWTTGRPSQRTSIWQSRTIMRTRT